MSSLHLKPTHKPVKQYYEELENFKKLGVVHETAVKVAFQKLLESCCQQFKWTLVQEYAIKKRKRVDGALVDSYNLARAYWEAKDSKDNLKKEVQKKLAIDYPKDNIIFQQPERAILYQDGKLVMDEDITKPQNLVDVLRQLFEYRPPAIEQWEKAADEFGLRVEEHATALLTLIKEQSQKNKKFIDAFAEFFKLCRQSINPNIAEAAVEEMLIQHLLTERIFRNVFNNPDFAQRNIIAVEIEKVINALTSKSFSRSHFLSSLDRFYGAIEETAATIDDFSQKQDFLNKIYERFFQGFSVKVADTHGIVYTPQPIVNFMVKSVENILQKEFGKSLIDKGVHILDPFVGTGNFIIRIMREIAEIQKSALPYKYEHELHCNEVMLLPYYIASMNIEHEYFEQAGEYKSFEGICYVDTFELAESRQLSLFVPENTARLEKQKQEGIFVIIGNPPYNANQQNEMDLNKNRQHSALDERIKETYIADCQSLARTTRKLLFDPYIKAFRWASDRISDEGIICFVSNNSFIKENTFNGIRKHLEKEFNTIYCLDLGGNVRKNPKLSGTTHNVFGIQVGVSINILIKHKNQGKFNIYYASVDEFWRKEEKYNFLNTKLSIQNIEWIEINPDRKNSWLSEGIKHDFDEFIAIGSQDAKAIKSSLMNIENVIFYKYSLGVSTNRDNWVYADSLEDIKTKIMLFCDTYNTELERWKRGNRPKDILQFVTNDEKKIKWSSLLLDKFRRDNYAEFDEDKIRYSQWRPFTRKFLYFDTLLIDAPTLQQNFFPTTQTQKNNLIICLTGSSSEKPFLVIITNYIGDLHLSSSGCSTQCFPFYTYDKNGTNRQENITDWALKQYQNHYQDTTITKWDIFYYIYAVLHHPHYRERYAANLKRELPRIPFAPQFHPFVIAGKRLAEIHINYEKQPEYHLKHLENKDLPIDWRVEKMRLSKDKTQIKYNDFLTLTGIPPAVFLYRLGNRSALDWIIDQYQVTTDKRSEITNDPNRLDDEQYIVRLIKQIITVSLETVEIVNNLPDLGLPKD
jgi:predicted helicase